MSKATQFGIDTASIKTKKDAQKFVVALENLFAEYDTPYVFYNGKVAGVDSRSTRITLEEGAWKKFNSGDGWQDQEASEIADMVEYVYAHRVQISKNLALPTFLSEKLASMLKG